MRNWFRSGLLGLAVLTGMASATTMLAMDVPALARSADVVVRGKVLSAESRWTADRARIVTDIEVEVEERLKGEPSRVVTIVQPGGVVGDVGQRVSGLASFAPGEEVVVFLERRGAERFAVAGMAQGKFRVERSSDGQSAFAIPDGAGEVVLLDPATRQPTTERVRPLAMDDLRSAVREALKAPPGESPSQQRGLRPGKQP